VFRATDRPWSCGAVTFMPVFCFCYVTIWSIFIDGNTLFEFVPALSNTIGLAVPDFLFSFDLLLLEFEPEFFKVFNLSIFVLIPESLKVTADNSLFLIICLLSMFYISGRTRS
jgi:hypothetical protein